MSQAANSERTHVSQLCAGIIEVMLTRKRSQQAATEAQWRSDVSAQLVLLTNAQTRMAEVAQRQRRPTRAAWIHAALILVLSGVVVLNGVLIGNIGIEKAATANSLQAQASDAISRVDKTISPIVALTHRKGAAWVLAHATKAEVNELNSADRSAKVYHADSSAASADLSSADRDQLGGPALLAFGSALAGAVLGWILTQWFGFFIWTKKDET